MNALHFAGSGFEYFKVWIVNILLMIVTLGLYYPWAKVRNRRYFYANSTLEGQNFEYHATGKQLFIGYLISSVLFIIYVVLQEVSPVSGLVVIVLFFTAFPWIIWRSMKFNMRVTSFSNVRFSFDGKLGSAYFNYMLLPALIIIALSVIPISFVIFGAKFGLSIDSTVGTVLLGLAFLILPALSVYLYSLMKKKNIKYMLDGSRYGQGQFTSNVEVAAFVIIILKTMGLFILFFGGLLLVSALLAWVTSLGTDLLQLAPNIQDPTARSDIFKNPIAIVIIAMLYFGFILISVSLMAYSYTRQRAYIYENTKLDNKIAFKSTLRARKFVWVAVTNLLLVIFTLGLGIPWARVRVARLMLENTYVDTSVGLESYVTQKQKEQSSLGEQIGDAFDVDVGMGL